MVNTRLIGNLNIVLGFNDFEKNGKIILFIDITWKIVHLIQTCTITTSRKMVKLYYLLISHGK